MHPPYPTAAVGAPLINSRNHHVVVDAWPRLLPGECLSTWAAARGVQGPEAADVLLVKKLACIFALAYTAAYALVSEEGQAAARSLASAAGSESLCSPAAWARVRAEVVELVMRELEEKDAAEKEAAQEGAAAREAQLAVDTADALATRPCAHPCCTTMVGPREADAPRGKRCGGCRLVRRLPPGALLRGGLSEGRLAGAQGGVPGAAAAATPGGVVSYVCVFGPSFHKISTATTRREGRNQAR